jgi:hypothetical protein
LPRKTFYTQKLPGKTMASIKHRYVAYQKEYKTVARYTVNFKDIFHLDNLYVQMHEWLVEHGYATRSDEKFPEAYYLHKDTPAGKEIWWRWRPTRLPLGEKNILWRFDLDIDCHVLTLKDVELVLENKKYAAHKGEVEVNVVANLVMDWQRALEAQPLLKPLKKVFFQRKWKETREMLEKELYTDAYAFRDAINTFLKLETYLPKKEAPEFWPKRTP